MSVVASSISESQPAHDTGQPDRAAVVGDEQVLGRQGPPDVVEGLERLPAAGPAYDQRPGQLAEVERVQRLADLDHDVVGDVDGERDRAGSRRR